MTKPKSIGHYTLGGKIGSGTFGYVRLGTHTLTGSNVAIKILEKDRICDASDIERVSREIHILKTIHHPHIVQLYEIVETSRQLYLIMEFASGTISVFLMIYSSLRRRTLRPYSEEAASG
jgi:5'-AMP-activated protein kinase catalytic alpha subunit